MTALIEHRSFLSDVLTRQYDRRKLIDPTHAFEPQPSVTDYVPRQDDRGRAGPSKRRVVNYVEEEETIRNDLSGWYVQSGEFGSNYIHGAAEHEICEEYPALRRLMDLKAQHVDHHSHPPLHLPLASTLSSEITSQLGSNRFDVILLRPLATWQETSDLPIRSISADPGFVFLWVGKGDEEGLERGRECFAKWGFRRAEDIVWVKTNRHRTLDGDATGSDAGESGDGGSGGGGLFASSKEHCLMGIRGTVRRSTDSRFVHCNVDTDIIIHEPTPPTDGETTSFPPYLYTLIENFCLGARRLELFGNQSAARRGWVTASLPSRSTAPTPSVPEFQLDGGSLRFDPTTYPMMVPQEPKPVVPFHPEIDQLRPKSPVRRGGGPSRGPGQGQGRARDQGQGQIQTQGQRYNPNPPVRPRPLRYDTNQIPFSDQYQQQPYHQSHNQQFGYGYGYGPDLALGYQTMDPMAMQMQLQVQMQMQIHQAQMMAAMGTGMMDPRMFAQTQAQAEAMQMQMQGQRQSQRYQNQAGAQGSLQHGAYAGMTNQYQYHQQGGGYGAHEEVGHGTASHEQGRGHELWQARPGSYWQ